MQLSWWETVSQSCLLYCHLCFSTLNIGKICLPKNKWCPKSKVKELKQWSEIFILSLEEVGWQSREKWIQHPQCSPESHSCWTCTVLHQHWSPCSHDLRILKVYCSQLGVVFLVCGMKLLSSSQNKCNFSRGIIPIFEPSSSCKRSHCSIFLSALDIFILLQYQTQEWKLGSCPLT